jgi:hypothetical protein
VSSLATTALALLFATAVGTDGVHMLQFALVEAQSLVVLPLPLPHTAYPLHLNYNLTSSPKDHHKAARRRRVDGLLHCHPPVSSRGRSPSVLSGLVLCEKEESLSIKGKRSNLAAMALILAYSCSVLAVLIDACISMSLLAISGFSPSILTSSRLRL